MDLQNLLGDHFADFAFLIKKREEKEKAEPSILPPAVVSIEAPLPARAEESAEKSPPAKRARVDVVDLASPTPAPAEGVATEIHSELRRRATRVLFPDAAEGLSFTLPLPETPVRAVTDMPSFSLGLSSGEKSHDTTPGVAAVITTETLVDSPLIPVASVGDRGVIGDRTVVDTGAVDYIVARTEVSTAGVGGMPPVGGNDNGMDLFANDAEWSEFDQGMRSPSPMDLDRGADKVGSLGPGGGSLAQIPQDEPYVPGYSRTIFSAAEVDAIRHLASEVIREEITGGWPPSQYRDSTRYYKDKVKFLEAELKKTQAALEETQKTVAANHAYGGKKFSELNGAFGELEKARLPARVRLLEAFNDQIDESTAKIHPAVVLDIRHRGFEECLSAIISRGCFNMRLTEDPSFMELVRDKDSLFKAIDKEKAEWRRKKNQERWSDRNAQRTGGLHPGVILPGARPSVQVDRIPHGGHPVFRNRGEQIAAEREAEVIAMAAALDETRQTSPTGGSPRVGAPGQFEVESPRAPKARVDKGKGPMPPKKPEIPKRKAGGIIISAEGAPRTISPQTARPSSAPGREDTASGRQMQVAPLQSGAPRKLKKQASKR